MSGPWPPHSSRQVFTSCGCFKVTVAVSHSVPASGFPRGPRCGLQVCRGPWAVPQPLDFISRLVLELRKVSGAASAISAGPPLSALAFQDLVTMVEQLARFLGVSCDKAQLEALIEHCHQLVDQCCNAEALPVGRGTRRAAPAPLPLPWVPSLQVFVVPHFSAPLPCVSLLQGTWKLGRRWPGGVPSTAVCPVSSTWCFSLQEWLLGCFSFRGQDVFMQVPSQMAPQSRAAEGFGAVKFRSSQHADGFLSLQLARGRVDDAGGGGSPCEGAPFSRTPSGCWLHR